MAPFTAINGEALVSALLPCVSWNQLQIVILAPPSKSATSACLVPYCNMPIALSWLALPSRGIIYRQWNSFIFCSSLFLAHITPVIDIANKNHKALQSKTFEILHLTKFMHGCTQINSSIMTTIDNIISFEVRKSQRAIHHVLHVFCPPLYYVFIQHGLCSHFKIL